MALEIIKNKLFDYMGVTVKSTSMTDTTDTVQFSAYLQPLRYKNKIYLSGVPTELGYNGMNKYLLIAPPEIKKHYLDSNRYEISFGENTFGTDHCELVYLGRKPMYYWAIVHREG